MKYNPGVHHRRSIRLKNYDYSRPGFYFVTICTKNRECLFGEIENGEIKLTQFGEIARNTWEWLEKQYYYVVLDTFVIMPNHLHGVLIIDDHRRRDGSRTIPTTMVVDN